LTPEEKENMALTIENAMLKGFEKFAESMDKKITLDIKSHKETCLYSPPANTLNKSSFVDALRDWRTIIIGIMTLIWTISATYSSIKGTPQKFTIEQVKQITEQAKEVMK